MSSDSVYPMNQIWSSLLEDTVVDRSIESYRYRTYRDPSGLPGSSMQVFSIDQTRNFIVPALGYVRLALKITNKDGSNIGPSDDVTIAGNVQHLFSSAHLYIDGTVIEDKHDPGFESHIKNIGQSQGHIAGFIPNTDSARKRMIAGSQVVEFCIPLGKIFDFFDAHVIPFAGTGIRIVISMDERSCNRLIVSHDANKEYDVKITDFSLIIPEVTPSSEVQAELLRKIDRDQRTTQLAYPYYHLFRSYNYKSGTQTIRWDISSFKEPLTDVRIVFVPTQGDYGRPKVDPCIVSVKNADLEVEGYKLPLELKAADRPAFGQIYPGLFDANEDSKQLTTSFHRDLRTFKPSGFCPVVKQGLTAHIELAKPLEEPFVLIALVGSERPVQINLTPERRITLDLQKS